MRSAKSYRHKTYRTFGHGNRRSLWENKPMGLWGGSHNDGGKTNNVFCLDKEEIPL